MVLARSSRASGPESPIRSASYRYSVLLGISLFAGLLGWERASFAASADDLIVVPAPSGQVGAWLAAGPLYGQNKALRFTTTSSSLQAVNGDSRRVVQVRQGETVLGRKTLEFVTTSSSSFNLRHVFHSRSRNVYALMAGVLRASKDSRITIIFGVDDGLRVTVDGRVVLDRDLWRPPLRADDSVQLSLTSGDHPVLVRLRQRSGGWRFRARVLDTRDLQPPKDVRWVLPGVTTQQRQEAAEAMLSTSLGWNITEHGYQAHLSVIPQGGVPAKANTPITVAAKINTATKPLFSANVGQLPHSSRVAGALNASLPEIDATSFPSDTWQSLQFSARIGDSSKTFVRWTHPDVRHAVLRVRQWLSDEQRLASLPLLDRDVVRSTLELFNDRLSSFVSKGDRDRRAVLEETRSVQRWLDALDRGDDPLKLPGPQRLAYRSSLDGKLRPFGVYVPPRWTENKGTRTWPLVVVLHGLNGLPMQMVRIFFGYDSPTHHAPWEDRHMPKLPRLDAFVVSPTGFGNLAYRQSGEQDVVHLLAWMKQRFPVDERRVYVTGLSMGGTGAAAIGLRFADQFAAAEPLCGYHSYKLRRDMAGRKRSWERALGKFWSNTSWAANGLHLPMYVVQGTKDKPAANSKVLIDRYIHLGYSMRHEHPDLGHNVWQRTYERFKGYRWLARHRRDSAPSHVILETPSLTYPDNAWVHVQKLKQHLTWGRVDARIVSDSSVRVRTSNILGFYLDRPAGRLHAGDIHVKVDGDNLTFSAKEPLDAWRNHEHWIKGSYPWGPGPHKLRDLTGPIRDIFRRPLIIVYGTADPSFTRINRDIARALASPPYGVETRWPVVADRDLTPDQASHHSLLLIGPPRSNSVLAQMDAQMPIHVRGRQVFVGDKAYRGSELGTMFIFPSPVHKSNYVAVIEAPTVAGMLRSLSLPRLLPDYVVYDEHVAGARGQVILRNASLVVGGMFDDDWHVVASDER